MGAGLILKWLFPNSVVGSGSVTGNKVAAADDPRRTATRQKLGVGPGPELLETAHTCVGDSTVRLVIGAGWIPDGDV
jgi:hypothetical protein